MKSIPARTFVAKNDSATKRRTRIDHNAKRIFDKKINHPDSKHISLLQGENPSGLPLEKSLRGFLYR